MLGESNVYCTLEVGERAVDRTRLLKFSPELVWEAPQERFRLAMEYIKGEKPARNSKAYITTSGTSTGPAGATRTAPDEKIMWSGRDEGTAYNAYSDRGEDMAFAGLDDSATPSPSWSNPTPAVRQSQHLQQQHQKQQQQVEVPPSSLTICVWRKGTMIGERQDFLVGSATVPAQYIDHPPGEIWLPLVNDSKSANPTSATTTPMGETRPSDTPGFEAKHDGGNTLAIGAVSGDPYPGDDAGTPTPAGSKKSGGAKSWASGLFKRGRGRRMRNGSTQQDLSDAALAGSIRLWLGKVRRRSLSGQQPGKGFVTLRVHAASGLRKVCGLDLIMIRTEVAGVRVFAQYTG